MRPFFETAMFIVVLYFALSRPSFAADRPNVIMILTDDQGSVDARCYGAEDLVTPNIDRLARHGVRFTQCYAAAPVCSPSRAGFLTGKVPQRAGVPGNVGQSNGLPAKQVTIAEVLQQQGYATAHVGKWHLGHQPAMTPNAQGFDYSFGHMGGCIDNYSHFFYWAGPNRHDLWENGREIHRAGEFFGDMMVSKTIQFIRENRDRPFFLYFAINMPHYPYQGDEKWLRYYGDLKYPRNLYAAFLSTVDERIGQVMSELDRLELARKTIVVFQSDHGHSVEERAHFGGGSSGPYRGHKFQLLEGGIRVPAIISWPGRIPEGQVRDQMVTGCDWFPTIAKFTNTTVSNETLDGRDITKVIQSAEARSPHESFCWHSGQQYAVRKGRWKLYIDAQGGEHLYDIDHDPGEATDKKTDFPDVYSDLQKTLADWKKRVAQK